MGLTPDGWFDWGLRDPGPLNKQNGGVNPCRGVVPHSAEGYWPYLGTLVKDQNRRASWAASNLKDGRFFQHYPTTVQTWTSGAGYPNNNFYAFENEGMAGEPLTDPQVANIVRVIRELSAAKGWVPRRPASMLDVTATLYEHRECVRWGADSTSCPSDRIPWARILAELSPPAEEEDMQPFLVWCPDRAATYLIGPLGARRIISPAVGDALAKDLGPHKAAYSGATIDAMNQPGG